MSLSEFLSIIEICVTILIGYYLSHWISVRDTQTRALKDNYISTLQQIRIDVDVFFDDFFANKLSPREISDWYGLNQEKFSRFDRGLRLALPIYKRSLAEYLNDIHEIVTGSEDFNEKFSQEAYVPNSESRVLFNQLRWNVDEAFNEYIVLINNSPQYRPYQLLLRRIESDIKYYKENRAEWWKILHPWLYDVLSRLLFCVIIVCFICVSYSYYSKNIETEKFNQSLNNERQSMQLLYFDKQIKLLERYDNAMDETVTLLNRLFQKDTVVVHVDERDVHAMNCLQK